MALRGFDFDIAESLNSQPRAIRRPMVMNNPLSLQLRANHLAEAFSATMRKARRFIPQG
jgi:hypothetical protein